MKSATDGSFWDLRSRVFSVLSMDFYKALGPSVWSKAFGRSLHFVAGKLPALRNPDVLENFEEEKISYNQVGDDVGKIGSQNAVGSRTQKPKHPCKAKGHQIS